PIASGRVGIVSLGRAANCDRGSHMRRFLFVAALAAVVLGSVATAGVTAVGGARAKHPLADHVLLLSVDGLHQSAREWLVGHHPPSGFAKPTHRGADFPPAEPPFPSDSFPGRVGQVTGGTPRSTGISYDDTWNHAMFPAGTTTCTGPAPGAEVTYF